MMEEHHHHLEEMASETKSTMAEEDLPKNYSMKSLRRFHLTKLSKDQNTTDRF
jgi:hypothetical protein